MVTGYTGGEKVNYNIVGDNRCKKIFTIPVGDIPEEEIDNYVRKVAEKFKKAAGPQPDLDCGIYPENNYFVGSAITTTYNTNYMRVEPNSHYWTNLDMLLMYLKYIQESGNQWYDNAWKAEVEQLIIGLENTIKNGYKLKKVSGIVNPEPYFKSVEDMITIVKSVVICPEYPANQFLKDFIERISGTIGMGYNLTNGLQMERKEIYKRLDGERNYQDQNWGSRRQMDGTPDEEKPVAEWINYIEYHLAKAKEKVYHLDTNGATHELRKVAALAVRAMEIHGCPERIVVSGTEEPMTEEK
jgi:hypothetical protein